MLYNPNPQLLKGVCYVDPTYKYRIPSILLYRQTNTNYPVYIYAGYYSISDNEVIGWNYLTLSTLNYVYKGSEDLRLTVERINKESTVLFNEYEYPRKVGESRLEAIKRLREETGVSYQVCNELVSRSSFYLSETGQTHDYKNRIIVPEAVEVLSLPVQYSIEYPR